MKLDLVVVKKSKVSGQLMELRILPTPLDKMKVAQREDPKLQKFREQMETVLGWMCRYILMGHFSLVAKFAYQKGGLIRNNV